MKKKIAFAIFLTLGIVLICLSVVFTIIAMANKDMIGGAGFPTFVVTLRHNKGGLFCVLSLSGIASIIMSVIVMFTKTK
jgi:hypothetical protein